MNRWITLLIAGVLCLTMVGCSRQPPQNDTPTQTSEPTPVVTELPLADVEIVGPWHLDETRNDLTAFADSIDLFPGYGEWGASMEIRSDGRMSWYIGAEGWHGTYVKEGDTLKAELTSEVEQQTRMWEFRMGMAENLPLLEMDYGDLTITWIYGDREDAPNGNEE